MSTTTHASEALASICDHPWLSKRVTELASDIVVLASRGAREILGRQPADCQLITATSSHLGHASILHASVCRYLSRSMIQARQHRQVLLVSPGSAIYPWAKRAAELFGVSVIEIRLIHHDDLPSKAVSADHDPSAYLMVASNSPLCRDRVMIQLADQVDCLFARPAGKVFSAIASRLESHVQGTVRIAIHDRLAHNKSSIAALKLMDSGALGWYCQTHSETNDSTQRPAETPGQVGTTDTGWTTTDGQWLIHCTRGHQGPWPGQTERQYRDELLLHPQSNADANGSSPLMTLQRILRMKRAVASSIATRNAWPVVCLSEHPLATLLAGRSYRPHLHRWDYEPFGIAIRKSAAVKAGCLPVLYGDPISRKSLAAADQFRFQSSGKTYDWTQEREWRFAADVRLDRFANDDVRVFVPTDQDHRRLKTKFPVTVVSELA